MGVDAFGMAMGLGFVLSFGYWCTDFLVVQRAMAADSMTAARRTPLIAAFPKMLFPFLVILPGLIALSVHGGVIPVKLHEGTQRERSSTRSASRSSITTWPCRRCCCATFRPGMLGLGLTALLASFMSGMAGNVTAFNTVWTYDIYQAYLRPQASDAHYLWVGRHGDGLRHRRVGADGVRRGAVQQHHGRAAAGVRVRQRAAAGDVPARACSGSARPGTARSPGWSPAPPPRRCIMG